MTYESATQQHRPPDHHAFPIHRALDFQHLSLSAEEVDDVQMVWWLFCGYCPQLDVNPVGTRTELTCMVQLIALRMRLVGEFAPRIQSEWPLYLRTGVAWACERVQRLVMKEHATFAPETAPPSTPAPRDSLDSVPTLDEDDLFPFARGPLPHVLLLVYLRPLLSQLSETARLMQPPLAMAVASVLSKVPKGKRRHALSSTLPPPPPAPSSTNSDCASDISSNTAADPLPPQQQQQQPPVEDVPPTGSGGLFCGLFTRKARVVPAALQTTSRVSPLGGLRSLRRSAVSEIMDLSDALIQVAEERQRRVRAQRQRARYQTPSVGSTPSSSSVAMSNEAADEDDNNDDDDASDELVMKHET
jgi:hypothetical protein